MLKADAKDLIASLNKFREENKKKMESMVRSFSLQATDIAISFTPLGDSQTYFSLYQKRDTDWIWESYGLQPIEGFARGSWRASTTGTPVLQENYGRNSDQQALKDSQTSIRGYNLGDTVYISNYGPYIMSLEKENSSKQTQGQGILKPTIDSVLRIAGLSLKNYYDKATG